MEVDIPFGIGIFIGVCAVVRGLGWKLLRFDNGREVCLYLCLFCLTVLFFFFCGGEGDIDGVVKGAKVRDWGGGFHTILTSLTIHLGRWGVEVDKKNLLVRFPVASGHNSTPCYVIVSLGGASIEFVLPLVVCWGIC